MKPRHALVVLIPLFTVVFAFLWSVDQRHELEAQNANLRRDLYVQKLTTANYEVALAVALNYQSPNGTYPFTIDADSLRHAVMGSASADLKIAVNDYVPTRGTAIVYAGATDCSHAKLFVCDSTGRLVNEVTFARLRQ